MFHVPFHPSPTFFAFQHTNTQQSSWLSIRWWSGENHWDADHECNCHDDHQIIALPTVFHNHHVMIILMTIMKVVRKKVMMWWQPLKTMILMIMMMMMVLKHDMTFVAFHLHWFHRNLAENSQSLIAPTNPTLPKSSKYKTQIQMPIEIQIQMPRQTQIQMNSTNTKTKYNN